MAIGHQLVLTAPDLPAGGVTPSRVERIHRLEAGKDLSGGGTTFECSQNAGHAFVARHWSASGPHRGGWRRHSEGSNR